MLGLLIRAPGWALNYSMSYRRAKGQFRQQLLKQGVPPEEADDLAECFPFKMSDILSTVRNIR